MLLPPLRGGYEIKVWKVLNFKYKISPFKEYIEQMYLLKSDPNVTPAARFIYKLLLNTLYGVMGVSQEKQNVEIVGKDSDRFVEILSEHEKVKIDKIDDHVIASYNYDYLTGGNEEDGLLPIFDYDESASNVCLAMSVSANARIHMHKLRKICESEGIKVLYTDTDSLFTDSEISSEHIGSDIGKLKLEYDNIKEAYFLGAKVYGLRLSNGKDIIKFKGVSPKTVNFDMIKEFYHNTYKDLEFNLPQKRFISHNKYFGVISHFIDMLFTSRFYTSEGAG